jgi:hypothetical protein
VDRYLWIAEAARRLKVSQKTTRKWFDEDVPEQGEPKDTSRSVRLDGFRIPGSGYRRLTTESVEALALDLHGDRTVKAH